jgi:hypothetical protein
VADVLLLQEKHTSELERDRPDRRTFRGVHKQYLHLYAATYEAMINTKRVTPELIRRMCICAPSMHTGYM